MVADHKTWLPLSGATLRRAQAAAAAVSGNGAAAAQPVA
jgi:hypothetical protein